MCWIVVVFCVEFLFNGGYFKVFRFVIVGNVRFYCRGVLFFSLDGGDGKNWILFKKIGISFFCFGRFIYDYVLYKSIYDFLLWIIVM